MSKEAITKELRRFLASNSPEVLCITGKWGVGKTHNWREALDLASKNSSGQSGLALKNYAYVSLFGLNSLADLKYAIFENTINIGSGETEPTFSSNLKRLKDLGSEKARKLFSFTKQVPIITKYVGNIGTAWFLLVRSQIVCFDDLERRGKGLEIRDVLGLASYLREEKRCKVVIILNEDELGVGEGDYKKFLEKVVDIRVTFSPSPKECISVVAGDENDIDKWISEDCLKLGVSNIRVIRKIKETFERLLPLIQNFDSELRRNIMHSIAVLTYAVYKPDEGKFLEYLTNIRGKIRRNSENGPGQNQEEEEWGAMLNVYDFYAADEFDLELLNGIQNGFFDEGLIVTHASKMQQDMEYRRRQDSLSSALKLYHESFDDNGADLAENLISAIEAGGSSIDAMNFSHSIELLKNLGRGSDVPNIISRYISANDEKGKEFFDLNSHPFRERITDADVWAAFAEKFETFRDTRSAVSVLLDIANSRGWNPEDIILLSQVSAQEFKEMFLKERGPHLSKLISTALNFSKFGNSSAEMKAITARATQALQEIGATSLLNRRRVEEFGVQVPDSSPNDTPSPTSTSSDEDAPSS
ncbi:hypothetical protein [Nitrospirillum sp. BR 11163]|uniref:hypothetical protein n=1 Tax=Nitrospirillum sp. BR 11163 TaxID=3104323 RepID=UPI002AFF0003|nr:hypothetical protein [Nitrospirillum sp. BR 11163]MEA1675469.1 hypothetical protein [Nitrospirillum sp. BR 11163]